MPRQRRNNAPAAKGHYRAARQACKYAARLRSKAIGVGRVVVWRRERDSNPRYGGNPYNALAGRPLRPLGHLSARATNYIITGLRLASTRLIELERLVQRAHGELHVFFVDHDRNLDLRGRDHLDVDALFGESAEHLARDSGVGTHADAHHRDLADL